MSKKVEYFEKYSVAPSPSRDYYGIKVLREEIIVFLWKISHGPHRAPTIRVSKFSDFETDKFLQEEIQRVFGKYVLEHVKNIAFGKEFSILTLPRNVIGKISKYLRIKDIINLSKLSQASKEVFDNDNIWEILYKKNKGSRISIEEKKFAMASSWKELFKEKNLQESIKSRKSYINKPKAKEPLSKKSEIKSNSEKLPQLKKQSNTFLQKSTGDLKKFSNSATIPPTKTSLELNSAKKQNTLKCNSVTVVSDESKKKLLVLNKFKSDTKEIESKQNQSTVYKNIVQKGSSLTKPKSSMGLKLAENSKSRKALLDTKLKPNRNKVVKSEELPSDSKLEKKRVVSKSKKTSEANIFRAEENLFNYHEDISSLIKESLKMVKSPRSIFSPDFSIIDDKRSSGDSKSLSPRPEIKKLIKEYDQIEGILKTSARSESLSDDDEKSSDMDNLTQKYLNAREEFMKSMAQVSSSTFKKASSITNSSLNETSLRAIPEDLKKTRASIFVAKEEESRKIADEISKLRLANLNKF